MAINTRGYVLGLKTEEALPWGEARALLSRQNCRGGKEEGQCDPARCGLLTQG